MSDFLREVALSDFLEENVESLLNAFDARLIQKGMELLEKSNDAAAWETFTKGRKNLIQSRQSQSGGTDMQVNQSLQASSQAAKALTPEEAIQELLRITTA